MKRPQRLQRWPWDTLYFTPSEAAAIRALREGTADEFQQREAFRTIVDKLCGMEGLSFTAGGVDGQRATDFSEGRRWVARMLKNLVSMELPFNPRGEPPPLPRRPEPPAPMPFEEEPFVVNGVEVFPPTVLVNPFDEVEEVDRDD